MAGRPIPIGEANDMIAAYYNYMTALGVDMKNQTQSVSFTGATLMEWLNTVMPDADELRVFFGLYPEGHEHAGRTTTILWPYRNGQPASGQAVADGSGGLEPFNDGAGNP